MAAITLACLVLLAAAPGLTNRMPPYRLPTIMKPIHYDVFILADLDNFRFEGEVKIRVWNWVLLPGLIIPSWVQSG